MSYIIQQNQPFINFKLTEVGREKLAQGKLNFGFWGIGDSEINYNREAYKDTLNLDINSNVLTPVDRQADLKHFLYNSQSNTEDKLNILSESNIRTLKYVVNNKAKTRGFFDKSGDNFTQNTNSQILMKSGVVALNGSNTINVGSVNGLSGGDLILIKVGGNIGTDNTLPVPYLWYLIKSVNGSVVTLDRETPNSGSATFYIYKGGEVASSYGDTTTSAYWNGDTLNFNASSDVSVSDVPVWNMNNVWDENIIGLSGNSVEKVEEFGSYNYVGTKNPYLGLDNENIPTNITKCDTNSVFDDVKKGVSIIHYTNNTISNFYGEFFYVDDRTSKVLELSIPTIMYHRRNFSGSATGDKLGMVFVSDTVKKTLPDTDIEYYELIEKPNLVSGTPVSVGKVYPNYKIIVIEDEEILATLSYKSNRNWTLPKIDVNLVNSTDGLLGQNKTMYLTYMLDNTDLSLNGGVLPQQKYVKVTNTTSIAKDVNITLEDLGLFPYMRKIEDSNYDNLGFYANRIKVLYQIIDDIDDRPSSDKWIEVDLTSNLITDNTGETINPLILESRNVNNTGLKLNKISTADAVPFNLSNYMNTPLKSDSGLNLQFGDERFFYGNVDTHIGATVYKTLFDVNVSTSNFDETTNPTKVDNPTTNLRISEMGIYDSERNLVGISKMSAPIEIPNGSTITLEASIDF